MSTTELFHVGPEVTNGAQRVFDIRIPYRASVILQGSSDLLFHCWNCSAIEAKSSSAKGSKAKKTDDLESYVVRNDKGELCIPGEYLRGSIVAAAKFKQDPRSPRKSASDLFKAAVVNLTPLSSLKNKKWDYEHRCRVTIQRSGISRVRPAIKEGWEAEFILMVNLPEYVPPTLLQEVIQDAGRLVGLADFRPTYGRFVVKSFKVLDN